MRGGRYDFGVQIVTVFRAPVIPVPTPATAPDLSGQNLKNTALGGSYLVGANLGGVNLNGGNAAGALLVNANLAGANLNNGANLNGAIWSHSTCPDGTSSDDDGGSCSP